MAKRHGKNGRILLNAIPLAGSTWTLDMDSDDVNVAGFGDNNNIYVTGRRNISGTISGFWDDANDSLFDAADASTGAGTAAILYLYPDAVNAPTQYWWGPALVKASINTDSNGAVGISGSYVAAGNWVRAGLP